MDHDDHKKHTRGNIQKDGFVGLASILSNRPTAMRKVIAIFDFDGVLTRGNSLPWFLWFYAISFVFLWCFKMMRQIKKINAIKKIAKEEFKYEDNIYSQCKNSN